MLDERLCSKINDTFDEYYDPALAVNGVSHLNPEAQALTVIFPPWHGGGVFNELLARRRALNRSVLNYRLHDQILEPDIYRVQKSFDQIAETIAGDLYSLQDKMEYRRIHFLGMSLGNVALTKTAALFPDFDSATLVMAGSCLAASLWEGQRTQNIRSAFEEQGITKKQLRAAWYDLAPQSHVKYFEGKPVTAVISRRDSIIPTHQQVEMDSRLQNQGAKVRKTFSNFGHAATLTSFCIKG